MGTGKGFSITSNLDLPKQLIDGYAISRSPDLPMIKIVAICNDAVATLVSFAYQLRSSPRQKAAMGLIVGTGCNATIPLALGKLHRSKWPKRVEILEDTELSLNYKITVNTEWTIKGAAGPLIELDFITTWDKTLDAEGDAPGFQPFEYMTAGRYLGELGRLIAVDYLTNYLHISPHTLPIKLIQRHGLSTSFLGNLRPYLSKTEPSMIEQLEKELPSISTNEATFWTPERADILFRIAKAVQVRAAGMTAAAIIALLTCADEITFLPPPPSIPNGHPHTTPDGKSEVDELMVGYTGGCIVHFQDYLEDCQRFLDGIMEYEFGETAKPRIVLQPCHDGGIIGAGILAGTVSTEY